MGALGSDPGAFIFWGDYMMLTIENFMYANLQADMAAE